MAVRYRVLSDFFLRLFVVLAGVGFPHLMVAGSLPSTDEGVYAYYAQLIHSSLVSGEGLPDTGMLMLYPMLLSWVFDLSVNHVIFLRLVDMIVAMFAGWLLYRVVETESRSKWGGALISLIFLFAINQPLFIQAGFKNSIFAAYIPLFLAMRLAQGVTAEKEKTWFFIGALTALSILLRETFLPFMLVGAITILLSQSWKVFLRFSMGAAVSGLGIVILILCARGGVHGLIDSYHEAGGLYAAVANQRVPLFIANGTVSAKEAMVSLCIGVVSMFSLFFICLSGKRPNLFRRFLFWVTVALVPLLEPFSKIGYPYHFAVCLPGLAGVSALAWQQFIMKNPSRKKMTFAIGAACVCVVLLSYKFVSLKSFWLATGNNLAGVGSNTWSEEAVSRSNYLLAAEAIRSISSPNSTLSVSGYMFALYPLTGLLPPSNEMSHLTGAFVNLGSDEVKFKMALCACPPDVLMTTTRADVPGSEAIQRMVEDSGLYQAVTVIPINPDRSYGNFSGTIYKKVSDKNSSCQAELHY